MGFRDSRVKVCEGGGSCVRTVLSRLGRRRVRRQKPDENVALMIVHRAKTSGRSHGWVVDVGAHLGGVCIPWAELGFECLAFEPNPKMREGLSKRVQQLPITIDGRALGSGLESSSRFYLSSVSSGISSLLPFDQSHYAAFEVDIENTQSALESHGLDDIYFLKCDAEGYDHVILSNLDFSVYSPEYVMVEFEWNKTKLIGVTPNNQAAYLTRHGYHVVVSEWFPVVKYGTQHRFRHSYIFADGHITETGWGNLLGFRNRDDAHLFIKVMNRWSA